MELHSQADKHPTIVERLAKKALQRQDALPRGPMTDRPGSDEYPGYPENAGRRPCMDPKAYRHLMEPIRVTVTREDFLND